MKKVFMIIAMALFTVGAMANTNPELEKSVEQSTSIMEAMYNANANSAVYSASFYSSVSAYGNWCQKTLLNGSTRTYMWNDSNGTGAYWDVDTSGNACCYVSTTAAISKSNCGIQ